MKYFLSICAAFCTVLTVGSTEANAKAAYASEAEMIAHSDVIAVVNIERVEKAEIKGEHWTYREKASAKVERLLKGTLPQDVTLYGGEDFICAQVHYQTGQALVFLRRDGELLTGCNWHLSVRPIRDERIQWYKPETHMELSDQSATTVLARVERMIRQAP